VEWKKNINIVDARKLSKIFCDYFELSPCMIYYVDVFHDKDDYGIYFDIEPTILILKKCPNRIGVLVHELTHHLQYQKYDMKKDSRIHGYPYQLARNRVDRWCNKYISSKPNWAKPLGAFQDFNDMKEFEL